MKVFFDPILNKLRVTDTTGGGGGGGSSITVVTNYSSLPSVSTVSGQFYWCSQSQGTSWLPGSLGGTYYNSGLYYSNGTSWEFLKVPYQATQIEVDAGVVEDKFVTPATLAGTSRWGDYLPLAGGTMDNGAIVYFNNNSKLREGITDAGLGGNKGIALVCSIDYELKWEAGRLYVMEQNGFTIREVSHNFTFTPTATDDDLKGFVVGSRWILDNGNIYTCSDSTTGAAVWNLNSGFIPYVGATQNVDLGEYELKAGQIELDQTPTGTAGVAVTRWNDNIGSTETTLKGGNVIIKNGVDLVARVVNKVIPNATLTRATYHAVRVSGAQGQRLAVEYAQANNDANSADTIGIVCENIATNQEGFILTVGQLEEINTTGSLQSETWVDGDVLYLSPITPGHLTNIKPTGLTGHIVVIGYVEYAHAVHGKIYVKIMNGWELDELHNVYIDPTTLANNDVLTYDSASSLWKNKPVNIASNLFNYYNFI